MFSYRFHLAGNTSHGELRHCERNEKKNAASCVVSKAHTDDGIDWIIGSKLLK